MSTAGQVIRCKAAVAWEAGKSLSVEEIEVAPPKKNEVRVKIHFTSLCHTDVYFWEAKGQNPLFPRILGHEAGGVVESVGEGVTDVQPGDHVLPIFTGECKECPHCLSEASNLCDLLRINTERGGMLHDGQTRFSKDGKPIYHFLGTSTFSEYTVVHVGQVAKINPEAPLDKVCVLSCGMSTGRGFTTTLLFFSILDIYEHMTYSSSLLAGFGATVNVAKPKKGGSVAVFGLGAVGLAVISEMTGGGVDCSIECTGSTQAMVSAFECVHDELELDKFITHSVPFLDINKAFEYMLRGEGLRCMIHMDA
ncbi:hypothetical protein PVK06_011778 [Gossypium arboreum]|uniref:Alcohol dehydrogenase-like N-terminal domain-containing protein n=1 Tax=Gossypium arboreum TaxID=29729 RepID=A0ABR0Q9T7_GOSAR|nr:hypothetical protein PVK06_011778 [Gossypium arboreum]